MKSKESHEIVIEVQEEVDYLVKRLVNLKAQDILNSDNDFLNTIYSKLPFFYQDRWDFYWINNDDKQKSEWQLFSEFLNEIYQTALMKRSRAESIKDLQTDNNVSTTKNEQF